MECENCICLVEKDNEEFCDELQKKCSEIKNCPEMCKKKTYTVFIHEILARSVDVEAESVEEAKAIVEKMYYDEEIVLTADDFAYREMREENEDDYEEF